MRGYPRQSSIVDGDFRTPDRDKPLPEHRKGGMFGDFELMPLERRAVDPDALAGREVRDVVTQLGAYGMGGYGFFGLCLGEEWLVVPIFGAAEWLHLDGRIVEDTLGDLAAVGAAWINAQTGDDRALLARLTGARIKLVRLGAHELEIRFHNGARLEILADPRYRPRLGGTGDRRAFLPTDDLRQALFLSSSPEIWV